MKDTIHIDRAMVDDVFETMFPKTTKGVVDEAMAQLQRERDAVREDVERAEFVRQAHSTHPLYKAFTAAVDQAMSGKGERHGGARIDFMQQQWVTLADAHGVGFLTGQAAKKLNEMSTKPNIDLQIQELLGAIVYAGMAFIHLDRRGK